MLSVLHKYSLGPKNGDNLYRNKVVDSQAKERARITGQATTPDPFRNKLRR